MYMKNNPVKAYIALGSNMGDREQNLNRGVEMLRFSENVEVTAVSSYVNTAPVGYTEQPDFLNAVVGSQNYLNASCTSRGLHGDRKKHEARENHPMGAPYN